MNFQLPENNDDELAEVKSTLEIVESFNYESEDHNIVKRGADDFYSEYDVEEEGRKWRNKNKRNKKIKKKNRKRLDEMEYTDVKFEDDIDEDVSDDTDDDEVAREPSSSPVLQFSAYSAASQPAYSSSPPAPLQLQEAVSEG